jgi:hypothetical protein
MSNSSGITIKQPGDGGTANNAGSSAEATGTKVKAASFAERAALYALTDAQCAEIQRENIAPRGSGSIRLFPICSKGAGGGEDLSINISCEDLSGAISIDPQMDKTTIDSQCAGSKRTKIDGYTVNIKVPLYLDKLLGNPALLKAMYQSDPVATATGANGTIYDAYGIGAEIYDGTLPRFYVEITPSETSEESMSGILFFPYAEMDPMAGSLSFGRTDNRTVELMLTATMPPAAAAGATKRVVSGIWRARSAA